MAILARLVAAAAVTTAGCATIAAPVPTPAGMRTTATVEPESAGYPPREPAPPSPGMSGTALREVVIDFSDESDPGAEVVASSPPPRAYQTLLPKRFRRPSPSK